MDAKVFLIDFFR